MENITTELPLGEVPYLCRSQEMEVTPATRMSKGAIGNHALETKVRVIRPDGFMIDKAVLDVHKVTQAHAVANGLHFEDVVLAFFGVSVKL